MEKQHPLIAKAKSFLRSADSRAYQFPGMVEGKKDILSIRCTPGMISRALLFMESLIHLLSTRHYDIYINNGETYALVKGYQIKIACHEKAKRVKVNEQRYSNTELHPTGLLSFKAGNFTPREWQDHAKDPSKRLENYLPDIMAWMEKEADYWNEVREGHRRDEELRKLQLEKENEAEEKRLAEVAAFDKLVSDAERFHMARLIREYIDEAERRGAEPGWVEWAREKVEQYDWPGR